MSEKWRIFIALILMQFVCVYIDIFNALPHMNANKKYVVHFLSIYATPVAFGVGLILYVVAKIRGDE
jgi:uncharacterized membrane protein YczE